MRIFIIGSLKQNKELEKLACILTSLNHTVVYAKDVNGTPHELDIPIIRNTYDTIQWAEKVIALKKPDGTFGHGTLYEIAYAESIGKAVDYAIYKDVSLIELISGRDHTSTNIFV